MRRIGLLMLTTAALVSAAPGWAQNSEMEQVSALSNTMQADQREVIQHNIDAATKALQTKDYATARKYAQMVTRADSKRVQAWLMLGTAQMGLQDWKRARGTYSTALRLSPDDIEAHAGLGVAMAMTSDPKAQVHLNWLNVRAQACGGCVQAGQIARLKGEVQTALDSGMKTPTAPGG